MTVFDFASSGRILFGPGRLRELADIASELGRSALILTGSRPRQAETAAAALAKKGMKAELYPVVGEPTLDLVREAAACAVSRSVEVVIGMGGGSVLDTGKAVAALLTNGGDPLDYLEVVGEGRKLLCPSAPCIAVPTTAGTGSEVTRNAVIAVPEHRVKVSMRSQLMLPTVALVDPDLTVSLPPRETALTGLDALTQVMEPFVSNRTNPLTDEICRLGLGRAAGYLIQAFKNGDDQGVREEMALASLCGGLALANGRLGAVHGFAGPLGGMYEAPHGGLCAALLPHVVDVNIKALMSRAPDHPSLARYDEVARILLRQPDAGKEDLAGCLSGMCKALEVPPLAAYGVTSKDHADIVVKARASSSMKGNPVELTTEELEEVLRRSSS